MFLYIVLPCRKEVLAVYRFIFFIFFKGFSTLGPLSLLLVILSKWGMAEVGVYSLMLSVSLLVSGLTRLGFDWVLLKNIPNLSHSASSTLFISLSFFHVISALLFGIFFATTSAVSSALFGNYIQKSDFLLSIAFGFSLSFLHIYSVFCKVKGNVFISVINEYGFIFFLYSIYLLTINSRLPLNASDIYFELLCVFVFMVVVIYSYYLFRFRINVSSLKGALKLLKVSFGSFVGFNYIALVISATNFLIPAAFLPPSEMGMIRTTFMISTALLFVLTVLNSFMPRFLSKSFYSNDNVTFVEFQRLSSLIGFCLAIPLALIILFCVVSLWALFFDEDINLYYLIIFILSQVVNLSFGSIVYSVNLSSGNLLLFRYYALYTIFHLLFLGIFSYLSSSVGIICMLALNVVFINLAAYRVFYVFNSTSPLFKNFKLKFPTNYR